MVSPQPYGSFQSFPWVVDLTFEINVSVKIMNNRISKISVAIQGCCNLTLDICCTKLQTKKNDINTTEGHFTVIYHAQHIPKASNLLPKWPSDLSNCMGAVSKWCPYKAVCCYFLVCALCISIQQMSKLILQPKNSLPCGLLHWQQHISEIVSSLLKQRIYRNDPWLRRDGNNNYPI